jgi:putative cardiolipin synthase
MYKKLRVSRLGLLICLALVTAACGSIPLRTPPALVTSLPAAETGTLHEAAEAIEQGLEPGQSAFWLLDRADFSFDARLALVDEAVESLDIQYFIWEKDPTSRLFSHRVIEAANRGVRVRILLDDLTLNGQDGEFSALAKHPNITVRSFNPWRSRNNVGRALEYLLHIDRLNHRMHNKTIIADGQFAMLGGRNIGDRYFGVWKNFVQNDLDIMTVGPAAGQVADSFDLYWNSELSYALNDIVRQRAASQALAPTIATLESVYLADRDRLKEFSLKRKDWNDFFEYLLANYSPGEGMLAVDLPDVETLRPIQLNAPLLDMLRQAKRRVLLSTAYLIPDQEFLDLLADLRARGVEIILLTNSLASNNHMVAHLAYKRVRKRLLDLGVELYEARDDSAYIDEYAVPPIMPEFLGLHSKAIVVDDDLSFVGSPNIDPRSLLINTEIGFIVESPELASRLAALIERDISPEAAWRVYRGERGRLRWTSSAGILKNQPALGFLQRVKAFVINCLPLLKSQA